MAKNRIIYYTQDAEIRTKTVSATTGDIISTSIEGSKMVGMMASAITGTVLTISLFDGILTDIIYSETLTTDYVNKDILDLLSAPQSNGGSKYLNLPTGITIRVTAAVHPATVVVALEHY